MSGISVIVPVYNAEIYLRQCVESVLAQTYSDWELILVDDGSTDGSGLICDGFAASDDRINVVHRSNGGLSIARNVGIDLARNGYITFLDADDMLHPQFLELSMDLIEKSDADAACFGFSSSKESLCRNFTTGKHAGVSDGKVYTELVLYQTDRSQTCSMCGKLFRSAVFDKIRFTPAVGYEDLDIFYRIFPYLKTIVYSDSELYYYRVNPTSYIHSFKESRKDVLDITDRMKTFFSEAGQLPDNDLYSAAKDRRLSAHFNILGLMTANSFHNPELETRCWNGIKEERGSSIFNPRVRLKNRVASLASYIGGDVLIKALSRIFY